MVLVRFLISCEPTLDRSSPLRIISSEGTGMSSVEAGSDALWRAFAQMRIRNNNLNDHLDLPHILGLVPLGNGARALDLGCGLGQSSRKLAQEFGYSVTAVDFDNEMLANARKLSCGEQVTWLHSAFEDLEFGVGFFSLIFSCL